MTRPRSDRGAVVVEFALVLPILLLLVFGIVEFGRAYSVQTSMTAAARAGARVMAIENDSSKAKSAAIAAAQPYALGANQITVGSCPLPNTTNAAVEVRITYPVNLLSGRFGSTITLTGRGVMRCNG